MLLSVFFLAQSASLAARPSEEELADLFIAACIDGSATLKKAEAKAIPFEGLPSALKRRYRNNSGGDFYQLGKPKGAYLTVVSLNPSKSAGVSKACSVAAPGLRLGNAFGRAISSLTGKEEELYRAGQMFSYSFTNVDEGYVLSADTLGTNFILLEVSQLDEQEKLRLKRHDQRSATRHDDRAKLPTAPERK